MLENIRVVLVNTSHPGNIGAAARAMKNMGLSRLVLVDPLEYPSIEAGSRAAGAEDLLDAAEVVDTLPEALTGCVWVAGTSARPRTVRWQVHDPRACAAAIMDRLQQAGEGAEAAIVFGRERNGLSNEELECCNSLVHIPANPEYSSLNLAAAVQVLAYECRMQALALGDIEQPEPFNPKKHREDVPAPADMLAAMYDHLHATLKDINFFYNSSEQVIMRRLKGLFNRAGTTRREVALLRGIFAAARGEKLKDEKDADR